jgi:hypothetical protein
MFVIGLASVLALCEHEISDGEWSLVVNAS